MAKRKSIWDKPLTPASQTGPRYAPTPFPLVPVPPTAPPTAPLPEPVVEPSPPRLDPPQKTRRKQRSKSNSKSRTHTVTFSLSKEEHKLFKAKTKEMKTTFSGLVRTALYSYLAIDPLERPK
jgi:hypothetical protein